MIQPDELAELLTIAAAADTRFPALTGTRDPRLAAWAAILGDVRLEDAHEAVMRIVRRPQMQVMQPGHVLDEAKALRAERLKAVGDEALVPPDNLPLGENGGSQYPQWLRAAKRYVGDGLSVEDALAAADAELSVQRHLIGPAVHRQLPKIGRTA